MPLAEHVPWIPLDGLTQRWATLALTDEPPPAPVLSAVSQALTALATEQSALSSYRLAVSWGREALHDYDPILRDLEHAATAWAQVAYALDRHLHLERLSGVSALLMRSLVLDALSQRERLWHLGLALLAEQYARYAQEGQAHL